MNKLYITGDIHGNPEERLSYKKHPSLRQMNSSDIFVFLGDFAIPFGINAPYYDTKFRKQDIYNLQTIDTKIPGDSIVICGNHEDYDFIETLPIVEKYNGLVRQMVFDNISYKIYFVDMPQVLTINGLRCLCIPGADSHDIDVLLDPQDEDFKEQCKFHRRNKDWFRIKGWTWWPQEKTDLIAAQELVNYCDMSQVDLVLTHDCPALFNERGILDGPKVKSTDGEKFIESVRQMMNPDCTLFHGHMHINYDYDNCICLYKDIMEVK